MRLIALTFFLQYLPHLGWGIQLKLGGTFPTSCERHANGRPLVFILVKLTWNSLISFHLRIRNGRIELVPRHVANEIQERGIRYKYAYTISRHKKVPLLEIKLPTNYCIPS